MEQLAVASAVAFNIASKTWLWFSDERNGELLHNLLEEII